MENLTIGRLSLDIEAAGARDPAGLCDRIAASARHDLKRGVADSWKGERSELIHIRRLEVDLTAVGDIPPERIGFELGRRIGRSIDKLLVEPDAGTVVFASPVARLATYVAALIAGDPVDRWWFAAFDGLKPLSRPQAIITALERDLDEARLALSMLPDPSCRQLPACLGLAGAKRFLAAMIGDDDQGVDAAIVHLAALARETSDEVAALQAVALFIEGCRAELDVSTAALAAAANLVAAYAEAGGPSENRQPAAKAANAEPIANLAPLPSSARTLLARLNSEARHALEQPRAKPRRYASTEPVANEAPCYMPWANLALLWPFVDQLPLERMYGAVSAKGCDPRQLTAMLVLATACGPDGAAILWRDPVWRDLFMLPPALTLRQVRRVFGRAPAAKPIRADRTYKRAGRTEIRWLLRGASSLVGAELAPRLARCTWLAMRAFAHRLPGFSGSSAPFIFTNFLRGAGRVRTFESRIEISIARPPLDILLSMTRLGDRETTLADGRTLVLRREQVE